MPALTNTRVAYCLLMLLVLCQGAMARDWQLAGLGQHQETGRDIYLGGIYLAQGARRPVDFSALPGPWKMEYRIAARRTSIRSLLGGMLLQSEVATGRSPGPATTEFADSVLAAIRSSLYAGDAFEIVLDGNVTYANLNGQRLARSSNPGVASYFLMGWIGEQGPASAFRNALLAPDIDPGLLAQHRSLNYSAERGAQVAAWFGAARPAEAAATSTDSPAAVPAASAQEPAAQALPAAAGGDEKSGNPVPLAAADAGPAPAPPAASGAADEHPAPAPEDTGGQRAGPLALIEVATATSEPRDEVTALGVQEYSRRVAAFHSTIVTRVYGEIRYPRRALRRELQGRMELDVVFSMAGALRAVEIASSSGHDILDEAAVEAAEAALESGIPAIDPAARAEFGAGPDELVVPVPVQFRLQ